MGGPPSRHVLGGNAIDADLALLQAVRGRGEPTARDLATILTADVRAIVATLERLRERGWLDQATPVATSPDVATWTLSELGIGARRRMIVEEALSSTKLLAIDRAHAALNPLDGLVRDLRETAAGSAPRAIDDDDNQRTPTVEYELHTRAERVVAHLAERVPRFTHHGSRLAGNDPLALIRPLPGAGHGDNYASAWNDLISDVQSSIDDRTTVGLMHLRMDTHPFASDPSPR